MRQEWRTRAACRDLDPDAPFATEGSEEEAAFIAAACDDCPVREACLEWALRYDDHGVIGGLNQRQRRAEQARRLAKPQECGKDRGYFRHRRRGETACDECREAHTAATRDAVPGRQRSRDRMVARLAPEDTGACGTGKGYQRHHYRGQEACEPCTAAKTAQSARYKTKAGGVPGAEASEEAVLLRRQDPARV